MNDKFVCKYCGKECKNKKSLSQHEIRCKENPNKIKHSFEDYNNKLKLGLIKGTNQYIKAKENGLEKPKLSSEAKYKIGSNWRGKQLPNNVKEKISKSCKQYYLNNPDKCSWLLSHSSNMSYPEQYFLELFKNEKINLLYHKQVGRYELDFYNEEKMIYIEIDGEQHYKNEKTINHDLERDNYLSNLGWKGFRIRWSDYKQYNFEEKKKIVNKIKMMIE